jgi:hypothetical protein
MEPCCRPLFFGLPRHGLLFFWISTHGLHGVKTARGGETAVQVSDILRRA